MRSWVGLVAAVAFFDGDAALAQADGAAVAAKFAALESVSHARLSPDGTKLAFVSEAPSGAIVYVADVRTGGNPLRVMSLKRSGGRITSCSWPANTRIVCRAYYIVPTGDGFISATRLYAVDADSKNLAEVTAPKHSRARDFYQDGGGIIDYGVSAQPGAVLMTRQHLPDDTTGSIIGSAREGLGVDLVDTISMKRTTVEQANADAFAYITDGHGTVRVMGAAGTDPSGYVKGDDLYLFRKAGEREWARLSVHRENGSGFLPVAVDRDRNVAYGFDDDGDYRSLFTIALDGTGAKTRTLGKPGYDVDSLITIGRNRRVGCAMKWSSQRLVLSASDSAEFGRCGSRNARIS